MQKGEVTYAGKSIREMDAGFFNQLGVFFSSLNENQYTFAIQTEKNTQMIDRFHQIGKLEILEIFDLVKERIFRTDDVPGLVIVDGEPTLLMEGIEILFYGLSDVTDCHNFHSTSIAYLLLLVTKLLDVAYL